MSKVVTQPRQSYLHVSLVIPVLVLSTASLLGHFSTLEAATLADGVACQQMLLVGGRTPIVVSGQSTSPMERFRLAAVERLFQEQNKLLHGQGTLDAKQLHFLKLLASGNATSDDIALHERLVSRIVSESERTGVLGRQTREESANASNNFMGYSPDALAPVQKSGGIRAWFVSLFRRVEEAIRGPKVHYEMTSAFVSQLSQLNSDRLRVRAVARALRENRIPEVLTLSEGIYILSALGERDLVVNSNVKSVVSQIMKRVAVDTFTSLPFKKQLLLIEAVDSLPFSSGLSNIVREKISVSKVEFFQTLKEEPSMVWRSLFQSTYSNLFKYSFAVSLEEYFAAVAIEPRLEPFFRDGIVLNSSTALQFRIELGQVPQDRRLATMTNSFSQLGFAGSMTLEDTLDLLALLNTSDRPKAYELIRKRVDLSLWQSIPMGGRVALRDRVMNSGVATLEADFMGTYNATSFRDVLTLLSQVSPEQRLVVLQDIYQASSKKKIDYPSTAQLHEAMQLFGDSDSQVLVYKLIYNGKSLNADSLSLAEQVSFASKLPLRVLNLALKNIDVKKSELLALDHQHMGLMRQLLAINFDFQIFKMNFDLSAHELLTAAAKGGSAEHGVDIYLAMNLIKVDFQKTRSTKLVEDLLSSLKEMNYPQRSLVHFQQMKDSLEKAVAQMKSRRRSSSRGRVTASAPLSDAEIQKRYARYLNHTPSHSSEPSVIVEQPVYVTDFYVPYYYVSVDSYESAPVDSFAPSDSGNHEPSLIDSIADTVASVFTDSSSSSSTSESSPADTSWFDNLVSDSFSSSGTDSSTDSSSSNSDASWLSSDSGYNDSGSSYSSSDSGSSYSSSDSGSSYSSSDSGSSYSSSDSGSSYSSSDSGSSYSSSDSGSSYSSSDSGSSYSSGSDW